MMHRILVSLVTVAGVTLFGAALQTSPAVQELERVGLADWIKLIVTIAGFLVGGLGVWFYVRALWYMKTQEASKAALDIYRAESEASHSQRARLITDNAELIRDVTRLNAALVDAKAKTDLTTVLSNQIVELSEHRLQNKSLADTLNKMMVGADDQRAVHLALLMKNTTALDSALKILDRMDQKLSDVADKA